MSELNLMQIWDLGAWKMAGFRFLSDIRAIQFEFTGTVGGTRSTESHSIPILGLLQQGRDSKWVLVGFFLPQRYKTTSQASQNTNRTSFTGTGSVFQSVGLVRSLGGRDASMWLWGHETDRKQGIHLGLETKTACQSLYPQEARRGICCTVRKRPQGFHSAATDFSIDEIILIQLLSKYPRIIFSISSSHPVIAW